MPAILAWGKENGLAETLLNRLQFSLSDPGFRDSDWRRFSNGPFNMILLESGEDCTFMCDGEKSVAEMVEHVKNTFGGKVRRWSKGPLFLNPYKLGILVKYPPPPQELEF
jgi:hypothetical protein